MSTILFSVETRQRGDYQPNVQYERFDEATHNGIQYVAIAHSSGHSPMDRDFWRTLQEMENFDGWMGEVDADGLLLHTMIAEKTGYGVHSGLVVAQQTVADMTVKVSAGELYRDDGERQALSAMASIAITAAHATNPRIDIVYVDADGAAAYLAGTAASSPSAPSSPTGGFLLAQIAVAAAATSIVTANITDKRRMLDMVRTATAAPTTIPDAVGVLLIDTAHGKAYISIGTASAANWKEVTFAA